MLCGFFIGGHRHGIRSWGGVQSKITRVAAMSGIHFSQNLETSLRYLGFQVTSLINQA